jgi:fumarylacetoacetase
MMYKINDTHDPSLKCRVGTAHLPGTDFPIQNLPFGVFTRVGKSPTRGTSFRPHIGVAIGYSILDLFECLESGLLSGLSHDLACSGKSECLNDLMALGPDDWSLLRRRISELLREGNKISIDAALVPASEAMMVMPARIGDYTDFYASIHHARNVGSMFRPESPLLPNYKYVPVGYHGRASSVVISGFPVRRPCGQSEGPGSIPIFGPSRMLDYELEVGLFIGAGNRLGETIAIGEAESHIFGLCLVNDWSARDIQKWEYQPLGPFLAKSFATTISPWIITMEALAPFRVPAAPRAPEDPAPLPYLMSGEDRENGGVDLTVEVFLSSEQMRSACDQPVRLSRGNFRDLYWTPAQLLTHHASNGCNLRPGDLIASGTVSGPEKESRGCLLELTWRGTEPVPLPRGETRRFLEDGDEVIFRARAGRAGFATIGFGECSGTVFNPGSAGVPPAK